MLGQHYEHIMLYLRLSSRICIDSKNAAVDPCACDVINMADLDMGGVGYPISASYRLQRDATLWPLRMMPLVAFLPHIC